MDIFTITVLDNDDNTFDTAVTASNKEKAIDKGIEYLIDNRMVEDDDTEQQEFIKNTLNEERSFEGYDYEVQLSITPLED